MEVVPSEAQKRKDYYIFVLVLEKCLIISVKREKLARVFL